MKVRELALAVAVLGFARTASSDDTLKRVADAFSKLVFRATASSTTLNVPFAFIPEIVDAGAG